MKIAVIYDSYFGNTQRIAEVIADSLKSENEVWLSKVDSCHLDMIKDYDLAFFGSPTRAFRATKELKSALIDAIKSNPGMKVAIFDTRADVAKIDNKFLKFMAKNFGYGIDDLKKAALKYGGNLVGEPLAVYVLDTEGPLALDEESKAVAWAKGLVELIK